MPEWLQGLIQGGLTVIALIVIILLLAALFMIIFGIATGIDESIQKWKRRSMIDLSGAGRLLLITGLVLSAMGALLMLAPRLPGLDRLGQLPGDLIVERGPVTIL